MTHVVAPAFCVASSGIGQRSFFSRKPIRVRSFRPRIQQRCRKGRTKVRCVLISSRSSTNAINLTTTASRSSVLIIISTIIGCLVLIGSVLYKVPQVVRIFRKRSARGVSLSMYSLETLGMTFSALYFARRAFPFATYGENVFILVQNVIILGLIFAFENIPKMPVALFGIAYFACLPLLSSSLMPLRTLMALQVFSIPILNLAKIPQIVLNFRRKGTGELAPVTLGLQLLGNVARIFTTLAQVRDPLMLISTGVATCFNTTLFVQWLYYNKQKSRRAVTLEAPRR